MQKKQISPWWFAAFIVWYVINIRVEAGIASAFERTVDGLVGGLVLLVTLYYAARFFGFLTTKDNK